MSEAGPSKKPQQKKFYKYQNRDGTSNRPSRGKTARLPGAAGGPSWVDDEGKLMNPMGMYRETPALEGMNSPGISVMTVKNKERAGEKELIEHLERIADELYPETSDELIQGDLDEQLASELQGIKGTSGKSKRFRLCRHEIPCVIYVNVLPPLNPIDIVYRIMQQVESTGRSPFKFIMRLIPVSITCGATMHQLTEASKPLLQLEFSSPDARSFKFAIEYKTRQSTRFNRLELIKRVAEEVESLGQGHSVDLTNPDKTILVEVDKNRLGMSVVDQFQRFKRFNPSMIAETIAKSNLANEPSVDANGMMADDESPNTEDGQQNTDQSLEVKLDEGGQDKISSNKRKIEDSGMDIDSPLNGDSSAEIPTFKQHKA